MFESNKLSKELRDMADDAGLPDGNRKLFIDSADEIDRLKKWIDTLHELRTYDGQEIAQLKKDVTRLSIDLHVSSQRIRELKGA